MPNPVTVTTRPRFLAANTNTYSAWDLRSEGGDPPGAGVAGYEDFRVLSRQAGANMSVDVGKTSPGLMQAWVRGTTRQGQGLYAVDNIDRAAPTTDGFIAQLNVDVSANSSGNPRIDQVVLELADGQHSGATNLAQIRVVAGTPTVGATLDNRLGAATLPASSILLADVIVANGETAIDAVDIRDRRAFPLRGVVPPLLTDVDMVVFESPALPLQIQPNDTTEFGIHHGTHDLNQAAVAMYLPRRIAAATRIRWRYANPAVAAGLTGNYVIAIFDASGRRIVDTGSVAWVSTAGAYTERSETIAATTFEAGWYYVFIGSDTSAGGAAYFTGVNPRQTSFGATGQTGGVVARNLALRSTTGGVTVPTTLLAMTDMASLTIAAGVPMVPLVGLSVG